MSIRAAYEKSVGVWRRRFGGVGDGETEVVVVDVVWGFFVSGSGFL